MNKCLYCGKPVKNKYCDVSCQNKHQGAERENKKYGELKPFNVLCKNCGKEFEVEEREKLFPKKEFYYCSKKCSNSRNHSEEVKKTISKSVIKTFSELFPKKQYICLYCGESFENSKYKRFCSDNCKKQYYNEKHSHKCFNCGKIFIGEKRSKFCSRKCSTTWWNKNSDMAINGGKASVLSQNKRSKNEVYFSELCCSFFNNVKLNEPIFNGWDADVILNDYKLAILWDGNWHHKQIGIKHSLLQVQNRDKIKIKEIIKFGYEPYIIKDYGKYDREFVESEFEKLKNYIITEKVL